MSNTIEINKYLPNYKKRCEVCEQRPTVTGVDKNNKVVYKGDMCGVCTFGSAKCLDPENWNKVD